MIRYGMTLLVLALLFALGGCNGADKGNPGEGDNGNGGTTREEGVQEPGGPEPGKTEPNVTEAAGPEQKPDLPAPVLAGLARAKQEKKLLVVHYHDEECNYCDEMDQVLALETVQRKLGEFVFVTLEMRRDKGAMKYAEQNYLQYSPSFLAYRPGGEQLEYSLEGFQPEKVFLVELENFKRIAAGKEDQAPPPTDHPSYGKG